MTQAVALWIAMSKQTMSNNILSISPIEWEIIEHRLDVPDALAGALSDTFGWDESEIEASANRFKFLPHDGLGNRLIDVTTLTEIDREVLKDCLEGSTFFADMDDEVALGNMTKGKKLAYRKAALTVSDKLSTAGIENDGTTIS